MSWPEGTTSFRRCPQGTGAASPARPSVARDSARRLMANLVGISMSRPPPSNEARHEILALSSDFGLAGMLGCPSPLHQISAIAAPPCFRQILQCPSSRHQILALLAKERTLGCTASLGADLEWGSSATGYHSTDVALGNCDAMREISLLLDGNASEGRTASKSQALARRATAGYCPLRMRRFRLPTP